jgi:hypothetical protein
MAPPGGPRPSAAAPQPFDQWQRPAEGTTIASGAPVGSGVNLAVIAIAVILPFVGALIAILAGIIYAVDANPGKKSAGKLWLGIGIVAFAVWAVLIEAASQAGSEPAFF